MIYRYTEHGKIDLRAVKTRLRGNFYKPQSAAHASPCDVLSMFWYITGEEALAELAEDVPEFDELWDEELTEDDCLVLIDRFKEKMEEEGE